MKNTARPCAWAGVRVLLDETPIGDFLEIEGDAVGHRRRRRAPGIFHGRLHHRLLSPAVPAFREFAATWSSPHEVLHPGRRLRQAGRAALPAQAEAGLSPGRRAAARPAAASSCAPWAAARGSSTCTTSAPRSSAAAGGGSGIRFIEEEKLSGSRVLQQALPFFAAHGSWRSTATPSWRSRWPTWRGRPPTRGSTASCWRGRDDSGRYAACSLRRRVPGKHGAAAASPARPG